MNVNQKKSPSLEEVLAPCKEGYPKVTFKDGCLSDEELILVLGAITTMELFEQFSPSIAHLHSDGNISRYGHPFGVFEDLIIEMPSKPKNGGITE